MPVAMRCYDVIVSLSCSTACVEDTRSFITSVIVGKDVVPRIGLHQLEAMRQDLINVIKKSTQPKVRPGGGWGQWVAMEIKDALRCGARCVAVDTKWCRFKRRCYADQVLLPWRSRCVDSDALDFRCAAIQVAVCCGAAQDELLEVWRVVAV